MAKKQQRSRIPGKAVLGAVALAVVAGAFWFSYQEADQPVAVAEPEAPAPNFRTPAETLSPVLFTGRTREAYKAAEEFPDLLAQLPCFCGCIHSGHKHNLDCFKDDHGVFCSMCQNIALEGSQMRREGKSVEQIRQAIEVKYSIQTP